MALGKTEVQLTILFALKATCAKLSSGSLTRWQYSLTLRKHMILPGNMALQNMHLKGHLPTFIKNFLSDRKFSVQLLHTLSDQYDQEAGVPQGSIISTTLFIIKINSVSDCLPVHIEKF